MTLTEISQAVETYFDNEYLKTVIAWRGVPFQVPDGSWVRFNLLPGPAFGDEVGGNQGVAGHRTGVVKIEIYTKPNTGVRPGWEIAEIVEPLFRRTSISGVFFNEPETRDNGVVDGWQQHVTDCPFWAWK